MTNLVDLVDFRRKSKGKRVAFDRVELRSLLNVYSKRVMTGEWRDYAIDQHGPIAVFSVFRNSFDTPAFSIAKRNNGKAFEYVVLAGRRTLKRGRDLGDVLTLFDKPLWLVSKKS